MFNKVFNMHVKQLYLLKGLNAFLQVKIFTIIKIAILNSESSPFPVYPTQVGPTQYFWFNLLKH